MLRFSLVRVLRLAYTFTEIKEHPLKRATCSVLAAILLMVLGSAASAQGLEERKQSKLKEEFLKKAPWILDYDQAREEAKKTGKPIFGVFSRSYEP